MIKSKVGVLTFHRCINYGSYWQARSLVEGLRSGGHDAVLLDHDSHKVNIAEWKCAYRPVLPTHVPASDYPLYRKKIKGFFRAFETLPLSSRFPLDNPAGVANFDSVVVGSDEVWNLSHPWYGNCPLFYGEGIHGTRLVSYAASFGNFNAGWGLDEEWASKLRNFSSISVRDENSRDIVTSAIGTRPQMVLDPCLQFSVEPDQRSIEYSQKPYAAVYGHNFSDSFIKNVRSWAHKRKLPLVSIGYRNDWADEQWITADPHDFAHFMKGTEALITNFFHGCVFALKNARPFVCETSPYRHNKLHGLMSKVGAENRLLGEEATLAAFEQGLNGPLETHIFDNIRRLRENSQNFLDSALNNNTN